VSRRIFISTWLLAAAALFAVFNLQGQSRRSPSPPVFRVGVESVFLRVSVIDPMNRFVTGLEKEYFKVFEDDVQQSISYFSQELAPISVGIIFDVSSSMRENNNIRSAKSAIARFLQSGPEGDEYFLITFNDSIKLAHDFTSQSSSIQSEVAFQKPGGSTALYDAVYRGLDEITRAKNSKKALILITDGEDNSSRYSHSEVRDFVKESDVQIYAIGERGKLGYGRNHIRGIVSLTGGRSFFPTSFNELDYYIDLIHSELRHQYILGYEPTNKIHDGKYRRLKIKLDAPEGLPKLSVYAKEGYYAPKS
jgi:Ca-activated chloride channel family protein